MSLLFSDHKDNKNNQRTDREETSIERANELIKDLPLDQIGPLLWDKEFPTRIIAYIMNLDSVHDFRQQISSCLTSDEIINTTTNKRLKRLLKIGYIRHHGRIKDQLYAQGKFEDITYDR